MLNADLLMRRSVRKICDDHQLTPASLQMMDFETKNKFQDLAIALADDMQFNQLKYFRPFEYQKKFFKTGHKQRRGILAANRIGKTVSTCFETAMHLTGLYADDWEGKRFNKPITAFVAGEGWEQVARVLQTELMGAADVKLKDQLGSGSIPRDRIVFDTMRSDGANIIAVEVKHISGENSYLLFGNYTQEVRNLQGFKLDLVVFDEQPPDGIFSELVTRTATTQGMVICSFTPLKGLNGLVSKFWNKEDGYEFVRVAWDDVPEYDLWGEPFLLKTTRRQLELDYLPHERQARIEGKPVMGKGAVFQIRDWPTYKTGDYDFNNIPDLEHCISLDLGLVNDKTVISLLYHSPANRTIWLHKQIVVKGTEEAIPDQYVNHLLRAEVRGAPIILPSDATVPGRYTMSSQSIRELFESHGLNVYHKAIMNPPDSEGRVNNHKSFGINRMRQDLEVGALLINENCVEFLREATNYYVDEKGRFSDPDDCIDSARYGYLACIQGISEPRSKALLGPNKFRTIRAQYAKAVNPNEIPEWKRTFDPKGAK
jgi:phage terminase large subunit-like protein